MADIVVLGGCIIDLVCYTKRFPKPGETIAGTHFAKGFGGKGANQCVMAKRLGASTAIIGMLGKDGFGQEYFHNMKNCNINTDHLTFANDSQTSTASICVTEEGQNSIVYVPGVIMKLTPEDVKKAEYLIKNAKILVCTYECPLEALSEALKIARKHEVVTVVNAAPTANTSYEKTFALSDIICLNEIEAEDAVGFPITNMSEAELAVKTLIQKNCSTVILTLGSKGVVFQGEMQKTFAHVPARTVQTVDSTGAGDAFMGSLAYFLADFSNLPLQEIIKRSCEIATRSVLKKGTQTSFPFREDLPDTLFAKM